MGTQLEHPRLLPAMLVPDPDRDPHKRSTRDWIVDVAAFVIAILGGLAIFADANPDDLPEGLVLADLLAGAIGCLALWKRRQRPVHVGLLLVALGAFSSSASVAAGVAGFTVAVHRPFRVVAIVAGLGLATSPIYMAIHGANEDTPYWFQVLFSVAITVAIVAWGMFVRARRQLVLSLRERAERAETEQQLRVEQARQHERAQIAREMHDVLAHRISLLSLHAGALEFRPDAPPDEVARAAGVIRSSAHQALEDLREVIGVLRESPDGDGPERPQPTLADLPALIDESRAAGMRVAYDWHVDEDAAVPTAVGRNAYRIVQEGLTNARKHARGAAVDVTVAGSAGEGLTIEIRNRMPVGALGAAEIPGAGTGIVGLAERASLAGGRLEHGRTDAGDYRLWAWLPWPA